MNSIPDLRSRVVMTTGHEHHWIGSGLAGIDGLQAGDVVTADQMLSLFGLGDHPLATQRLAALTLGATDRDIRNAMQLGQRYGVYPGMTDFTGEKVAS